MTVLVNGDTAAEADEQFQVKLSAPVNGTIADDTGVGTILDDDSPTVSIGDVSLNEGDFGYTAATFTLTLSAPAAQAASIGYQTVDGSATSVGDYAAASGIATFAAGETTADVTILVQGDVLPESNETFSVDLNTPVNARILDGHGVATIVDDDPLPELSIGDQTVVEGNTGTTPATFTVTLSTESGRTVTVDYATSDGTANQPGDYQSASGTLTFSPGQTSKTVTVLVKGDAAFEANETFTLGLSNPAGATTSGTGTGTIFDDDLPISIADATVTEGNSGTVNAVFAVTLGAASTNTVTVDYSTFDGSAVAPGDYAATSGTLTFTPGQTAKQISVPVNGDSTVEANETFTVNLTNPSNAAVSGTGIGTGTITNDDTLPSLSIGNATVTEGNSGTVNACLRGHPVGGELQHSDGRLLDVRRVGGRPRRLRGRVGDSHLHSRADGQADRRRRERRHADRRRTRRSRSNLTNPPAQPSREPGSAPGRSPTTTHAGDHDRERDGERGELGDDELRLRGDVVGGEREHGHGRLRDRRTARRWRLGTTRRRRGR